MTEILLLSLFCMLLFFTKTVVECLQLIASMVWKKSDNQINSLR